MTFLFGKVEVYEVLKRFNTIASVLNTSLIQVNLKFDVPCNVVIEKKFQP